MILIGIILLLVFGFCFVLYNYNNNNQTYNLGGIEIKKTELDKITEPIPENTAFALCDISKNKCVRVGKLGE